METQPASTITVSFDDGDKGRSGPLAMGQRNMLMVFGVIPAEKLNFCSELEIPDGVSFADIRRAFGRLVVRNQSLRTRYVSSEPPRQVVASSGEFSIPVYEIEGDPAQAASHISAGMLGHRFALDREFPFRVAVVATAGPSRVIMVVSHVAVDWLAMTELERQLNGSWAPNTAGSAARPARSRQPVDQALVEATPQWSRWSDAAVRYWYERLERSPNAMFSLPDQAPSAGTYHNVVMRSTALSAATHAVAARAKVTPTTVMLGAVMVLVAHYTSHQTCAITSMAGNRIQPELNGYVGCIAQDAHIAADLSAITFYEALKRVWPAALAGYRHSHYEARQIWTAIDQICATRGTRFARDCVFNDLSRTRPRDVFATLDANPAALPALTRDTLLIEVPLVAYYERFTFLLWGLDSEAVVSLQVDTRRIAMADNEALLRGLERLLVAAATQDVRLDELSRLTGVACAKRDDNWRLVDSCWVDLRAIERLLLSIPDVTAAKVCEIPALDGTARLRALVAARKSTTPTELHVACVAALQECDTAMAPHLYTICRHAPADPDNIEQWVRQPVLRQGDGRPAALRVVMP